MIVKYIQVNMLTMNEERKTIKVIPISKKKENISLPENRLGNNTQPDKSCNIESVNCQIKGTHATKTKSNKRKKKHSPRPSLEPDKNQLTSLSIEYLNQWKNNRSTWKFVKKKQVRLISNMFDSDKLPDESFTTLLEYVAGGSENLKKLVLYKANRIITDMENWQSLSDEEKLTASKINNTQYMRARDVIQNIHSA